MEIRFESVNISTVKVLVKILHVNVKTYTTKSRLFNRAKLVPIIILSIQYTIHTTSRSVSQITYNFKVTRFSLIKTKPFTPKLRFILSIFISWCTILNYYTTSKSISSFISTYFNHDITRHKAPHYLNTTLLIQ